MSDEKLCPYKVGDIVFYRPSVDGYSKTVMHAPEGQLEIGEPVRITSIVDSCYIVYEGYQHPAGGIFWTEFSAK